MSPALINTVKDAAGALRGSAHGPERAQRR